MGSDKLFLEYQGKTLLQRAVDLMLALPVYEKMIITMPERSERIVLPSDVHVIKNTDPEAGQSHSVRLGTEAAGGTHYLFLNADQPLLTAADIEVIFTLAGENRDKIIFPVIKNKPCSPALFPASFRAELLELTGDTGGRVIRDAYPGSCLAFIPECGEHFKDIDNREDYDGLF